MWKSPKRWRYWNLSSDRFRRNKQMREFCANSEESKISPYHTKLILTNYFYHRKGSYDVWMWRSGQYTKLFDSQILVIFEDALQTGDSGKKGRKWNFSTSHKTKPHSLISSYESTFWGLNVPKWPKHGPCWNFNFVHLPWNSSIFHFSWNVNLKWTPLKSHESTPHNHSSSHGR